MRQDAAEAMRDHVPGLRYVQPQRQPRALEGQKQEDGRAASCGQGKSPVQKAGEGHGLRTARRVSRPASFIRLGIDGSGEDMGSDRGVRRSRGPADHPAVHSLHAQGQAGDSELDPI